MAASDYSLWGWEIFFEELETFLTAANREIGLVSREYAEFVLVRLAVCIQALFSFCRQIESEGEVYVEILANRDTLVEIRGCCHSLRVLWQSYIDQLDSNYTVVSQAQLGSYQAPRLREGRGVVPMPSSHLSSYSISEV